MLEDFRLKVFVTVAGKGSFTLAAKELGITQPAVSQNVAELEKSLGTELFTRNRGAVALTSAGSAFMEYASGILRWYSAAGTLFGHADKRPPLRTVSYCAAPFVAGSILPGIFTAILASDPSLSFKECGEDEGAELRFWCEPHLDEPTLDSGLTLVKSVPAVAVAGDGRYSKAGSMELLPPKARLAVWKPYSSLLTPVDRAMVAFESESPEAVCRFVSKSPDTVGLIPLPAASDAVCKLHIQLPALLSDLHFTPSDAFAEDPLCELVLSLLRKS